MSSMYCLCVCVCAGVPEAGVPGGRRAGPAHDQILLHHLQVLFTLSPILHALMLDTHCQRHVCCLSALRLQWAECYSQLESCTAALAIVPESQQRNKAGFALAACSVTIAIVHSIE